MILRSAIICLFLPAICGATGVLNGGGGKGVLCEFEQGRKTLEVLDLYEAKNIFHLAEEVRHANLTEELTLGMERLNEIWAEPGRNAEPVNKSDLEKAMNELFFSKLIPIPKGSRLALTMDATVPALPTNCYQVQVALYNDLGIQIDQEYWDMMDFRNQAALIYHEALYYYRRAYGAYNSDETRKFIGRLFSTTPPIKRFLSVPETGYYDCTGGTDETPIYDFIIYPYVEDQEPGYLVSFRQINNATTLGRTTAFFTGDSFFKAIGDSNSLFGIGMSLRSEFKDEKMDFLIKKTSVNGPMLVKLKNRYTGEITRETQVSCERK